MFWRDFDLWSGLDVGRDFGRLREEVNRLFEGTRWGGGLGVFPPVNVWTDDREVVVTAEAPGLDPHDLEVQIVGDTLTLKGTRKPLEFKADQELLRQERESGTFTRTFSLPYHVDPEKVTAVGKNGVFEIICPRSKGDRPKKIAVRTA